MATQNGRTGWVSLGLAYFVFGMVLLGGLCGAGWFAWYLAAPRAAAAVVATTPEAQAALRIAKIADARKKERTAATYRAKLEAEAVAAHGPLFLKAVPNEPGDHPAFAEEAIEMKKVAENEAAYAQCFVDGARLFKDGQYTLAKGAFKKAMEIADTKAARDAYLAADQRAAAYASAEEARRSLPSPAVK